MLGIVMTITTSRSIPHTLVGLFSVSSVIQVCTATNAIVMTISSLGSPTEAGPNGLLLPESALRALLFIPLMATNVLATLLISYTAWYVYQIPPPPVMLNPKDRFIGYIVGRSSFLRRKAAATETSYPYSDRASEWVVP